MYKTSQDLHIIDKTLSGFQNSSFIFSYWKILASVYLLSYSKRFGSVVRPVNERSTQTVVKCCCHYNYVIHMAIQSSLGVPCGLLDHLEGHNEDKNEKSLTEICGKLGRWNSCPSLTVRLATSPLYTVVTHTGYKMFKMLT